VHAGVLLERALDSQLSLVAVHSLDSENGKLISRHVC
jgi:hypothetical protein